MNVDRSRAVMGGVFLADVDVEAAARGEGGGEVAIEVPPSGTTEMVVLVTAGLAEVEVDL